MKFFSKLHLIAIAYAIGLSLPIYALLFPNPPLDYKYFFVTWLVMYGLVLSQFRIYELQSQVKILTESIAVCKHESSSTSLNPAVNTNTD